jgi:protein involved in polysaccharide export with SLBB domain
MPMIRFVAFPWFSQRRQALLQSAAIALAISLGGLASNAQAQFSGNAGNDLTTARNQDASRGNADTNGRQDDSGSSGTSSTQTLKPNQRDLRTNTLPDGAEPNIPYAPYEPGEFEQFVQAQLADVGNATGRIRRFGANLLTDPDFASVQQDPLPSVPGDYVIRPGDEVLLTIWGTVDADLRLTVDREGRISVPHVGSITLGGLRNAELVDTIQRRVAQVYKNFQLSATLGRVRAIRVFVSGYVQHPGSITVSGLASVLHTLMRAGGPSAAGSFRDIHLRRGGREVAVFDLYDLLLKGNRDSDRLVQPDDVIFVGPVGSQVAMVGSVNQQAIYELKPNETIDDVLRMAGGFNAVADRTRVAIEPLTRRTTGRVVQLKLPEHGADIPGTGDLIRAFSAVTAALPEGMQNQRVRIEGEVLHPGDYVLPPGSRISDALSAAGGMTTLAYPFGTEFTRESVRETQQVNYDRALRDLETDMSRTQASQRATSTEDLNAQSSAATANARLLDRLRQVRPTGRVVLQLQPDATALPDLVLQDGDTLKIPARSTSVGIFGSVFTTGSFVYEPGHTTQQYLALAGGPMRGADKGSIFLIRANGSVISARQGTSFWHSSSDFNDATVVPGDTIFVPEELNKSTFVQDAKDWTQILYQFGLGLAGIKALGL